MAKSRYKVCQHLGGSVQILPALSPHITYPQVTLIAAVVQGQTAMALTEKGHIYGPAISLPQFLHL